MSESYVVVDDELFAKQGVKLVFGADRVPVEFLPGTAPDPAHEVLMREGEPSFVVRSWDVFATDVDVPDVVGLAVRRAAERINDAGEELNVEWVHGPTVRDGGLVVDLDTDGRGFTPATVARVAAILVAELDPLAIPLSIGVPSGPAFAGSPWTSSQERS